MSDSTTPNVPKPNAEAAKYRKRAAEYKARVSDLETRLAEIEIERDAAITSLKTAPTKDAARIVELEGQIRLRDHRDAFGRLAAGKIRPEALQDAFTLSGWTADADKIDEDKMGAAIGKLLETRPYLKAEEAKSEPAESGESAPVERHLNPSAAKPQPVKGAGRGPAPETAAKHQQSVWKL
ncbi:hypothetical protein [Paludisphaera rhizosphaerae]|uniref:hypothetical protein n=1 Tax=Paludisphaera rhizosphaerae TaxID=2711216 RepID=UPI0013ED7417|nr:hypothetical protein [Paludisphaera rhizosphaerae]